MQINAMSSWVFATWQIQIRIFAAHHLLRSSITKSLFIGDFKNPRCYSNTTEIRTLLEINSLEKDEDLQTNNKITNQDEILYDNLNSDDPQSFSLDWGVSTNENSLTQDIS